MTHPAEATNMEGKSIPKTSWQTRVGDEWKALRQTKFLPIKK